MTRHQPTFYERYYLWVMGLFLLFLPLIVIGAIQARKTSNNAVRQWLPDNSPATILYSDFLGHFGTDEFAIVSWEGCTLEDPRLDQYIELLESYRDKDGHALFMNVSSGPRLLDKLTAKPFSLSRRVAMERLKGIAIGHDGQSTCALVELTEEGDKRRKNTVLTMRELATENLGIAPEDLHTAGDAVTSAEVDLASENAINSLVAIAGIVAFCCAYLSLRSLRLVLVVFMVAAYAAGLSQAMVPWLGGTLNLVLVVMPVLVYVLSLSAGVHLVNYYEDVLAESGRRGAPLKAMQHGWLPCVMAAGTTAIGLGSLAVSPIMPVKDFGIYSAIGILASLLLLFLLLPSLLVAMQRADAYFVSRADKKQAEIAKERHLVARVVDKLGRFVIRRHVLMSILCCFALGLFSYGAMLIKTSVKPSRFFTADSRLMVDYWWLADDQRLGPQVPMELVVRFDEKDSAINTLEQMQLVRDLQEDLKAGRADLIGSVMSATTFAPDLNVKRYERFTVNERLEKNLPDYREVHFYSHHPTHHGSNAHHGAAHPESEESKVPMLERDPADLWRISLRLTRTDTDYDIIIGEVQEHVNAFLKKRRAAFEKEFVALDTKYKRDMAGMQKQLAEQAEKDKEDPERLAEVKQQYELAVSNTKKVYKKRRSEIRDDTVGVSMDYTGMVPLFHEAQRQLLIGLVKSFILAFVLIALLMIVWFKSIVAGLVTMLPNVFPAALIFGGMGWLDMIVDIGAMMTASVAMGIAVDDTVHFLTWFRRGLEEGRSRTGALLHAYERCALAMTQTTMIAGFGLLVFAYSSFQPVAQFGFLMFVLLVAALIGDLIFLPALLAGRAGKLFEPKNVASPEDRPTPEAVV